MKRDDVRAWWVEVKRKHLRPRAERAVGFAIGLFYPRVFPRLTMLDYQLSEPKDKWSPMTYPQASIRLYCLDTQQAVTLVLHGDQVYRLMSFVRKAYGKVDGTTN